MRTLTDFLAGLPGIKPRLARAAVLKGGLLLPAELADIRPRDGWFKTTLEIGPDAAAGVLAAYSDGRLPMKAGETPSPAPDAEAYLVRREELVAERDRRLRREAALKDASLVVEADLGDHRFLDDLFHAHTGAGSGSLVLDGIEVTKTVSHHPSNSGKREGWTVRFEWTGRDGVARNSSVDPPEAFNRRNDPKRNHGLPG